MAAPRGPRSASRVGWGPAGEESCRWPLRENDRGEVGFRSDMPHRAAEGLAGCKGLKERAGSRVGIWHRWYRWRKSMAPQPVSGCAVAGRGPLDEARLAPSPTTVETIDQVREYREMPWPNFVSTWGRSVVSPGSHAVRSRWQQGPLSPLGRTHSQNRTRSRIHRADGGRFRKEMLLGLRPVRPRTCPRVRSSTGRAGHDLPASTDPHHRAALPSGADGEGVWPSPSKTPGH